MTKYDLAIIGSGPCGYVAGIRAAQLGLKVCLFEKDKIGGVCLNYGCIPTKVLANTANLLLNTKRASEYGVDIKGYNIDFLKVYERKEAIVKKLTSTVEMLLKSRRIEIIRKEARIKDNTHITGNDIEIEAQHILIATGSIPFEIPGLNFDGRNVLSSTDMLNLNKIPKSITIIGGGVIGCEFASIFNTFGSEITIVEMMEQLLPNEDEEIARKIEQIFKKRGMMVFTKTRVEKIDKKEHGVDVMLSDGNVIPGEKALICVGRAANSAGLGIERLGIGANKGWIKVDEEFKTSIKNIYAAGDVKGGILLAHMATREGIFVAERICGKSYTIDYNVVPNCIFTYPEIASVGLTEKKARDKGSNVIARKFLFSAVGKSHVSGDIEGFIKLVVDSNTDKILGAQIIGHNATELIAELSVCVQFGITSENLAKVIHAHPTLSEVIYEAAEAVHNRAIHSV